MYTDFNKLWIQINRLTRLCHIYISKYVTDPKYMYALLSLLMPIVLIGNQHFQGLKL